MAIAARHTHTFDDFRALVRARRRGSAVGSWPRYVLWLAIYLAVLAWFSPDLLKPETWREGYVWAVVVGGVVAMAVIILLVDQLFDRLIYRLHYRRLATAGAEVTLSFDEGGVDWAIRDLAGRLPWTAVQRVDEQDDHLVLFISSIEGMVVPRRAFVTGADFEAARALIREQTHGTA